MRGFLLSFCALFASAAENPELFRQSVLPILQTHCASCHSGNKPQSGFSVTSYDDVLRGGKHGPGLVPGIAKESAIVQFIRGERKPSMPLGSTLPEAVVAKLVAAIDSMQPVKTDLAKGRDPHLEWLLQPPKRPQAPAIQIRSTLILPPSSN